MNIVLMTAHSILEFDELRVLHALGHHVLSIGAYLDPANPSDDKRPALPEVPAAPAELRELVADQMVVKSNLPAAVLDWADVVICHFFTIGAPDNRDGWLTGNWQSFKDHGNRVIWRTTGQSNHVIEALTEPLRRDGLEIVRYSPKERALPHYAGDDAIIRFAKDPTEWSGWTGEQAVVGNVTQNLSQRGDACGYPFWQAATAGLAVYPAGPGSEEIGGTGSLSYDEMRAYLRRLRGYLYTGTQPASYTLGLIEALLTGVPVVSIGPVAFGPGYLPDLFEAAEITGAWANDPAGARTLLTALLNDPDYARFESERQRAVALDLFSMDAIVEQWRAVL